MGEPVHPATVHFPITFVFLTGALDGLYFASITPSTASYVNALFKTFSIQIPPVLLPTLSYYSTILTLLTAAPAAVSGGIQLWPLIQRDGLSSKKAQTGVLHALVNDVAFFAAAYNWWSRRNENAFLPSTTNVVLSGLAVPTIFFGAYLGGALVYKYGMGVGQGSAGKAKKAQ